MNSWAKTPRSLLPEGFLREPEVLQVIMYCILQASFKPRNYRLGKVLFHLEENQLVTSVRELSRELRLTERKIRTALNIAEISGYLTRKPTQSGTVITVWYPGYKRILKPESDTRIDKRTDEQTTQQRHTCSPNALYNNILEETKNYIKKNDLKAHDFLFEGKEIGAFIREIMQNPKYSEFEGGELRGIAVQAATSLIPDEN
jgi:hypothetical protein